MERSKFQVIKTTKRLIIGYYRLNILGQEETKFADTLAAQATLTSNISVFLKDKRNLKL
ncbi:MAG: hypothetical protein ACI86M_003650 [Saprospiraceae bacterium]|jgi:hypothetical protein